MKLMRVVVILAAALVVASHAAAQCGMAAPSGFMAEAKPSIDDAMDKAVKLAEAVPAEKYTWRPAEGVRSISEVFMHMAGAAYGFANTLGTPPPQGVNPREFAGITDKARVVEELKKANEHLKAAVAAVTDVEKKVRAGQREITIREAVVGRNAHMHEHLGQAIAYARMSGVVPPWTAEREERQRQQPPAKNPGQ